MPKRRYERREPTHDWSKLRPLLKDPAQLQYEIIRPVILFGQTPTERAAETGMPRSTIYYRANLFDQAGMASLFPAAPPLQSQSRKNLTSALFPRMCAKPLLMFMLNTLLSLCGRLLPSATPASGGAPVPARSR